jgi:hypothetical protein
MNITQETNDYFSTTENSRYIIGVDPAVEGKDFSYIYKSHISRCGLVKDDYCNANSSLKDKLKTTPAPAIRRVVKCTFRVNWNKIFKKKHNGR